MGKMVKVNKPITLKFEDREINLPNELKENIDVVHFGEKFYY